MKIDLRVPMVVISGAWNPAIFEPEWIARHLFQIPEGKSTLISELIAANGERHIRYIDDVGISVLFERVEFFANSLDKKSLTRCENAAINTLKTLSHTPVGSFGINYQFSGDVDNIYEKLQTSEKLEEFFTIKRQSFSSVIAYTDAIDLNINRLIAEEYFQVNFNYHHAGMSAIKISDMLSGSLEKYMAEAKKTMQDLYDVNEFSELRHEFTNTQKETAKGD